MALLTFRTMKVEMTQTQLMEMAEVLNALLRVDMSDWENPATAS